MIILLLLLTTSSQPSPPPPPPSGCATELVAFSPCLPYVSLPPNNLTDTVMPECCNVVSSAFQSGDGDCLCYLLRQPLIFGFPLNETRVLSLSSVCNANGSVELICSSGTYFFNLDVSSSSKFVSSCNFPAKMRGRKLVIPHLRRKLAV